MLGVINNREKGGAIEVVMLARTFSKVQSIPNSTNAQLVKEMYEHLKSNGVSERHQLDVHN